MFGQKRERSGAAFWVLAAGAAVGIGAVIWMGMRRKGRAEFVGLPERGGIEDDVIEALRRDTVLRARAIDVASIAPGIIELSGTVDSEEEAHHAVEVVQRVAGIRTVLNRLDLSEVEQRLNRKRTTSTVGAGSGSRWYGMGVGTGRRRQSPSTDPDRRDDSVELREEAILPDPEEIIADLNEEKGSTV